MSKKSRDLVTSSHLPGILLASMAECERWIATGLIPVAERRAFRKGGRTFEASMFDAEVIANLAADVPAWRTREETEVSDRRGRAAQGRRGVSSGWSELTGGDDAAHRHRQRVLAS